MYRLPHIWGIQRKYSTLTSSISIRLYICQASFLKLSPRRNLIYCVLQSRMNRSRYDFIGLESKDSHHKKINWEELMKWRPTNKRCSESGFKAPFDLLFVGSQTPRETVVFDWPGGCKLYESRDLHNQLWCKGI